VVLNDTLDLRSEHMEFGVCWSKRSRFDSGYDMYI
jgi:hypothetical protein